MLQVMIPEREFFDENSQEFVLTKGTILQLEHSLVSLSKWESKWCKPFLGQDNKTDEEVFDYIRCMTINQNVPPEVYDTMPNEVIGKITAYINAPMTATWINEHQSIKKSKDIVTTELIYYWMIAQNIPMECQKWHLNRLLTLIRVCNIKNQPPKKMGRGEMLAKRRALNKARRSKFNSKG